jgi:HAE1 family hydrophobic/amphiphilic exporter-1
MYRFFINRPIVAIVIAILMVVIGVVSMLSLPVAQFPNIVPPEIRIQATFLGGDAKTLAQSVATPIEEQMSGVDNMNYMYSISAASSRRFTAAMRAVSAPLPPSTT